MKEYWIVQLILLCFTFNQSLLYKVVRKDPFATLADTLKTNQRASCEGETLHLECPSGTKISIQLVLYGRTAPSASVCPPTNSQPRIYTGNEGFNCNIPEALRTVEELCQSKQSCSIITSTTSFGVGAYDPCPGLRKYVEVAYKCRPTTFSSRMVCGGENVQLECNESSEYIAIFSSSFRSAGSGPLYCPLRTEYIENALDYSKDNSGKNMKKCEKTDMTRSVIKYCHGRKECNIVADPGILGAPACQLQHVLLQITYACMVGSNFLPKYIKDQQKTTVTPIIIESDVEATFEPNDFVEEEVKQNNFQNLTEHTFLIKHSDTEEQSLTRNQTLYLDIVFQLGSSLGNIWSKIQGNGWKLLLVLTLSTGLGVSCFLFLIIIRLCSLYRRKHESPRDTPSHVDLDTAMLDYEINTQLHTPLPEPKIMQMCDELPTKFSTLTRGRTRPVSNMAPLENYLGEPPKDTVIRYSTIGRNRAHKKPLSDTQ